MLQVHNPSSLNLPPLMFQKATAREEMENSPKVANFIRSNLLLLKDFHELFHKINKLSKEIREKITVLEGTAKPPAIQEILFNLPRPHTQSEFKTFRSLRNYLFYGAGKLQLSKKDLQEILPVVKDFRGKIVASIKRHSTSIQNSLSAYETRQKTSLDILTPVTLYHCRKCNGLLSTDRFSKMTCKCGERIEDVSKTRREPLVYFDRQFQSFIENNYWFEHGVDYLLRRRNFQTLCGVHVLGHSGNMHEIDNISESTTANFRFFCECKTSTVSTTDVFVLAGKMADVGCSKGYIFTLANDSTKEIRHLGRSRNISIIGDIHNRSVQDILAEIRDE